MIEFVTLGLAALMVGTISFAGGWQFRGLRDRYRAEVARDRAWDEAARERDAS